MGRWINYPLMGSTSPPVDSLSALSILHGTPAHRTEPTARPCLECATTTPLRATAPTTSECSYCEARYINGVVLHDCYDCLRSQPVTDLLTSDADTWERCEDCHEQHERARARERWEQSREDYGDYLRDARKDGAWAGGSR